MTGSSRPRIWIGTAVSWADGNAAKLGGIGAGATCDTTVHTQLFTEGCHRSRLRSEFMFTKPRPGQSLQDVMPQAAAEWHPTLMPVWISELGPRRQIPAEFSDVLRGIGTVKPEALKAKQTLTQGIRLKTGAEQQ
jgi:hypothetical protein